MLEPIYRRSEGGPLRQGEIISGLYEPVVNPISISSADFRHWKFDLIPHPLVIIVSQDCDLEQEYNSRNRGSITDASTPVHSPLTSILFCDVHTAEALKSLVPEGKDIWKRIKQNKD